MLAYKYDNNVFSIKKQEKISTFYKRVLILFLALQYQAFRAFLKNIVPNIATFDLVFHVLSKTQSRFVLFVLSNVSVYVHCSLNACMS